MQRNLLLVNDLFKSIGSVENCMTDRASVHTENASEQFFHRNRTLILVHTVTERNGKFDPKMLRIARICVFGVFTISFFVKNRELRPDKNKFAFTLDKLTMELDEIQ